MHDLNRLRARLLVSCDFIEFLMFFCKFKKTMMDNSGRMDNVLKFCDLNRVNFKGMITMMKIREDCIAQMSEIGLNFTPKHENILDLYGRAEKKPNILPEFVDYVIRIKRCILEGFKQNIAIWNDDENSYICRRTGLKIHSDLPIMKNLPVIDDKIPEKCRPDTIVYDGLIITRNRNRNDEFVVNVTNGCSVLSGFVEEYMPPI